MYDLTVMWRRWNSSDHWPGANCQRVADVASQWVAEVHGELDVLEQDCLATQLCALYFILGPGVEKYHLNQAEWDEIVDTVETIWRTS